MLVAAAQVATAIRGAIILAKMSVIPVRRGYWGNKIGKVHTVPTKVTGKCGSVTIRLIPAPRGAGARASTRTAALVLSNHQALLRYFLVLTFFVRLHSVHPTLTSLM
jgi:ribosomal protein S5